MKVSLLSLSLLSFIAIASTDRIPLPPGVSIEGVKHIGGYNFLLTDILNGRIMWFDANTNLLATIIQGAPGRTFQGLTYDTRTKYIFAAGSGPRFSKILNNDLRSSGNPFNLSFKPVTASFHVYDILSGKEVASCAPEGAEVINDVVIDWRSKYAYFTETFGTVLYKVKISAFPKCEIEKIQLPTSGFGPGPKGVRPGRSSGLTLFRDGIVISNFGRGSLWYYDLQLKKIYQIVEEYTYGNPVGSIVLGNRCLLVADNTNEAINIFRITQNKRNRRVSTTFKLAITSENFTRPSTFDAFSGRLVVANFNNEKLGKEGSIFLTSGDIPPVSQLC